jgi:hypothetical protein
MHDMLRVWLEVDFLKINKYTKETKLLRACLYIE